MHPSYPIHICVILPQSQRGLVINFHGDKNVLITILLLNCLLKGLYNYINQKEISINHMFESHQNIPSFKLAKTQA